MSKRKDDKPAASFLPDRLDPEPTALVPADRILVPAGLKGSFDTCGGCGDYLPLGRCPRCMPIDMHPHGTNLPVMKLGDLPDDYDPGR